MGHNIQLATQEHLLPGESILERLEYARDLGWMGWNLRQLD